jgi:hypothetical protein
MSTLAWLLVAFVAWLIVLAFALSLGKSAKDADAMIERWFKVVPVVLLFILLFPIQALCSPYMICDPQAGVTYYTVEGDTFWTGPVPAQPDGSIKSDLLGMAVGTHSVQVRACVELWGCSDPSPFSFTRPALRLPGALTITK